MKLSRRNKAWTEDIYRELVELLREQGLDIRNPEHDEAMQPHIDAWVAGLSRDDWRQFRRGLRGLRRRR